MAGNLNNGAGEGEGRQILNNRPPGLENDFGVRTAGDELDEELMPDKTTKAAAEERRE